VLFCCIGCTNTIVDAAAFAALVALLGWDGGTEAVAASALGFAAGAVNSYVLNSRITFGVRLIRPRPVQIGRFLIVTVAGVTLSGAVFALVRELWPHGSSALAGAKGVALTAGTVLSFFLQRVWVFRAHQPAKTRHADYVRRVQRVHPLAWLLLAGILVRLPMVLIHGYWWDIELFARWAATGAQQGLLAALYLPEMDYVGYNYVLTALGYLYTLLASPADLAVDPVFARVLKLPALAGDLLCVILLYHLGSRIEPSAPPDRARRSGLLAGALYAFNPAVLYDSAYWGQVDSLVTAAMLAAIALAFARRPAIAGMVMAVGFLVKPQPILLLPLVVWLGWRWSGPWGLGRGLLGGFGTFALGVLYFWLEGAGQQVRTIYRMLFETGEQISVSAWNGWWVVYRARAWTYPSDVVLASGPLEVSIKDLSNLLLGLAVVVVIAFLGRRPTLHRAMVGAAFLVLAFYMLPMKMHERYLFPLFAMLAPVAVIQGRWLTLYVLLAATFVLNLYAIFPFPPVIRPEGTHRFIAAPADVVVSTINVLLFLVCAAMLAVSAMREWRQWLPERGRALAWRTKLRAQQPVVSEQPDLIS
jgi:putative flippase GtrA